MEGWTVEGMEGGWEERGRVREGGTAGVRAGRRNGGR